MSKPANQLPNLKGSVDLACYRAMSKRKVSEKFKSRRSFLNRTADSFHHDTGNQVWINVGSWSSVLKVSVTFSLNRSWNSDRSTSVSNTVREGLHRSGLVLTGQSEVVVVTVQSNVLGVSLGQFLDGGLDGLHTAWNSHRGSRNVGMASSTVPVSLERLWMEGDLDTKLLSDLVEQVSGHPQLVTHLDTFARSNLELPLGRHHLGVDTGNSDTGMQAGSVVGLDNVSGKHLTGTNTTVVWSLWGWETSLWPSVDRAINRVQQSVFLFQTKPDFFGGVGGHELVALMSVVELVWSSVVVPALSQDNNVVALSEWVWVESDRSEVDIGVVAWGLAGGRTVKVPLWQLGHISDFLGQGSSLGSHIARTVNPDVLGNHLAVLVQVHILGQGGCVF